MLNFTKLLTTLCLSVTLITQAQMTNFALFPNKVSVSTSSTTATTMGGALNSTTPYDGGNAVFDENGNLLFAIRGIDVYNGAGNWVGHLPLYTAPNPQNSSDYYNIIDNDIIIIPLPNTCRKYKVIYILYGGFSTGLFDVDIDAENGVTVLPNPSNYTPIRLASGMDSRLAVSKAVNGTRSIYFRTKAPAEIRRYLLAANGTISFDNVVISDPILNNSNGNATEMDLSPNGKFLYWAVGNTFYSKDVTDSNANIIPIQLSNLTIYGVELFNGYYYLATSQGLRKSQLNSTNVALEIHKL